MITKMDLQQLIIRDCFVKELVILNYVEVEHVMATGTFSGGILEKEWELLICPKVLDSNGETWFHLGFLMKEVSPPNILELSACMLFGDKNDQVFPLGKGIFHTSVGSGGWFSMKYGDLGGNYVDIPKCVGQDGSTILKIRVQITTYESLPE